MIYTRYMLYVYLDESFERVDKKLWKVSICGVEIEENQVEESVAQIASITSDVIRFPQTGRKAHFSEMDDAQQSQIVEVISKLPISAKVYTYYLIVENESVAKCNAMERAVGHLQYIHRTKDISVFVEYADEYKESAINNYIYKNLPSFILPDSILSVYTKYLKFTDSSRPSATPRFYTLLKAKIRLQTFIMEEHQEYNQRDRRL